MQRLSLNQAWQFAKLPDGVFPPAAEPAWEAVSLPNTWYRDDDQYHGLAVYTKTVPVEPGWDRVFLEFEGADQTCRVYVNGAELGVHRGGYARFRFPVPEAALQSGALRIEAVLDNRLSPDISPNFGDFTVFGGLYRGVNLLITGENHFDYGYYGTACAPNPAAARTSSCSSAWSRRRRATACPTRAAGRCATGSSATTTP